MSSKQRHLIERQYSSKPGFIRVKLIELDPAPVMASHSFFNTNMPMAASSASFLSSPSSVSPSATNITGQFSNKTLKRMNPDVFASNAAIDSIIDPYCAVNIKELVLVDEKANTKTNSRKASQSQEPNKMKEATMPPQNQPHTTFTLGLKKSKFFLSSFFGHNTLI
jgi:hypothetical protein